MRRARHAPLRPVGRHRSGAVAVRGAHSVAFRAVPAPALTPSPPMTEAGRRAPAFTASASPGTGAVARQVPPEFGFEH